MAYGSKLKLLVHSDQRHAASREMLCGILRFASTHPCWDVQIEGGHPSNESFSSHLDWKPDALITNDRAYDFAPDEYRKLAGRLVCFVNSAPRTDVRIKSLTVLSDDQALASRAANLLLSKDIASYAFVGSPNDEKWSHCRESSFRTELKKRGKQLQVFIPPRNNTWKAQSDALTRWIKSLQFPCGIWCAYDQRAKHVLDACRFAGISVPDQVKVLGVDDEFFICEQTIPRLSSISPDYLDAGYKALEAIDAVLHGVRKASDVPPIKIGVRGIVERESTGDSTGSTRRIASARDFIHQYAATNIGVEEIARAIGCSRRQLETDFRKAMGSTVVEALRRERLEIACRILRTSQTKVDAIPSFCGFHSSSYLKAIFRHTYGMTMSEFRQHSKSGTIT